MYFGPSMGTYIKFSFLSVSSGPSREELAGFTQMSNLFSVRTLDNYKEVEEEEVEKEKYKEVEEEKYKEVEDEKYKSHLSQ